MKVKAQSRRPGPATEQDIDAALQRGMVRMKEESDKNLILRTIYIEKETLKTLRRMAKDKKISEGDLIRAVLSEVVQPEIDRCNKARLAGLKQLKAEQRTQRELDREK